MKPRETEQWDVVEYGDPASIQRVLKNAVSMRASANPFDFSQFFSFWRKKRVIASTTYSF